MASARKTTVLLLWQMIISSALVATQAVDCSFETSPNPGDTCDSFSSEWGLTVSQLETLNPGISCPNLDDSQLYCVVGSVSAATSTTSMGPTSSPLSTTTTPPTTLTTLTVSTTSAAAPTSPAPYEPQQSGLAANCDQYYFVSSGDSCSSVEAKFGVSEAQFQAWNPSINSGCTNLWVGYYVCVGVPGSSATSPMPPATSTTLGSGISTPTPVQTGIAANCNKFDPVKSGDTCSAIAAQYDISLSDFLSWNPAVGASCSYLDIGYYVCVDVIGYEMPSPTPSPATTTSAGNGVATPTPFGTGMVDNCNDFHYVTSGETCESIAAEIGVTVAEIEAWNPNVGSSCADLFLDDYICVGVL